jgi:hypothetical protein
MVCVCSVGAELGLTVPRASSILGAILQVNQLSYPQSTNSAFISVPIPNQSSGRFLQILLGKGCPAC